MDVGALGDSLVILQKRRRFFNYAAKLVDSSNHTKGESFNECIIVHFI